MKNLRVCYLLGSLLLYLSFAMLVPLLWAMWDGGPDRMAFCVSVLITLGAGHLLMRLGSAPDELSIRESFIFVTLAWILAAGFSALPFFVSQTIPSFTDAFFEAMSGLTTTGASIVMNIEALPKGILFWRSMTHWLGGMGIIVLFVAVFPRLGVSAGHMLQAESPGPITQRITPRIAQTAKILWVIYITVTVVQTAILMFCGFSLFDALTQTFGTVATGGFATRDGSIAAFNNPAAEWTIILFMLIAGGNFALYYHMAFGKFFAFWRDGEVRFYLLMVFVVSVIVLQNIQGLYEKFADGARHALFQVVSIITTTGFTTADYDAWPNFSRAILLFLMFVGGCGGSTAGAIKQIRLLVLFKYLLREIKKTMYPQAVIPLRVGQNVIPLTTINSIIAFIGLYFAIFAGSVIFMSYLGHDLVTALSAVAATQGNVGPGLGTVGPSHSYAGLQNSAKIWLSMLMLVGRLEIYTVFALLIPDYGLAFSLRRAGLRSLN